MAGESDGIDDLLPRFPQFLKGRSHEYFEFPFRVMIHSPIEFLSAGSNQIFA